jgi:NAD(P)-dependent dehydrogenase (short-subunit alcohol dehydrogenase family)
VNNAGVAGPVRPLVEVEPQEWDDVFAVNVRGAFLMCRAFLPPMIERGSGRRGQRRLRQREAAARAADAVLRFQDGADRADDHAGR